MGYRRMDKHVLATMFRRWIDGQSVSTISEHEGFDRKTVRTYVKSFEALGYQPGQQEIDRDRLEEALDELLPTNQRARSKREQLEPYREELIRLINPPECREEGLKLAEAVKPKTAFLILVDKYHLDVSYETFKLYAKEIGLAAQRKRAPVIVELPPGQETQIDYGTVGMLEDQNTGKRRRIHAFASKLSCSRLPYIQFCYSQNTQSFVESNVRMAEFYGGLTECLLIDNLKAGVLKPHVWDPQINRAYAEFAEHYHTFIDTARIHKATDKAKVERLIPQARELFRRLKTLHPTFTLEELNREALGWCRSEYGMSKHGTTGIEPMVLFEQQEKPTLKPLPATRFEVPVYKKVTVHPDRFFNFEKKRFCMPAGCRGKQFIARYAGGFLRVFDCSYRLVRSYPVTEKRISWLPGDFPESQEALMNGTYPRYLLARARCLAPAAERLIAEILKPHAWVKARHAQGMLAVLEAYRDSPHLQVVCADAVRLRVFTPKQIKSMFESERKQQALELVPPMSKAGRAMTRDIHEYLN